MKESTSESIAIIGLAGRFPGAADVDEFWRNLIAGKESISTFSDEELAASGLDVAVLRKDPNYVATRGVLSGAELFDASFFGMNAKEAEITDPQQRLFLETSWHALENAGYDPERADGLIGVYAGVGINTYNFNLRRQADLVELVGEDVIMLGNEKDFLATRVAYKLNLKGPALNISTACSTSLVAIGQACQGLLNYQCDLALAGGVSVAFPQKRGVHYQEDGIHSPDGHTRVFDAKAQGTIFSDALGIVVLKRLSDAVGDGDRIFAVIKGFGLNNDGAAKVGFTAPSVDGQAEAIALAQADAGFDPATISYVECHGTATPLGDPIEIAALTQAFRARTDGKNFCAIGSVKSNIGHSGSAAGVASLIKTALALKHKMLPASLHFTKPNPKIDFSDSPFFVNSKLTEWKAGSTPRRAGVSSFGFGGTNAHAVLEEAPAPQPSGSSREWQLLLFSAKTASALDAATANFLAHLKANPGLNLADAAFTLQTGRRIFPHRRMLVCRDVDDAIEALGAGDSKRVITHHAETKEGPVVFMFPGQGAQYVNMGADLYRTEPVFQAEVDQCAEILIAPLGLDLHQVLFPAAEKAKSAEGLLVEARIAQPALFVVEYALAKLWMSWGIKPQAMIGHSVGEYAAGCLAGVFTLEEALGLVAGRARLVQAQPGGAMLAVRLGEKEVTPLLSESLSIAAINSPSLCVISGPEEAMAELESQLKGKGIAGRRLDSSHAFHSVMMDPVVEPLTKLLEKVNLKAPVIPYVSNVTAQWITPGEAMNPRYWAKHVRQTVRFAEGVGEMLKSPEAVLLEVGPGRTLSTFANQHPAKAAGQTVLLSFSSAKDQEISGMLTALGRLWLAGKPVDWSGFYAQERRQRVGLPGYPFERKRFWIKPAVNPQAGALPAVEPRLTPSRAVVQDSGADRPAIRADESAGSPPAATSRKDRLLALLRIQFQELSGADLKDPSVSFMELGLDSLLLSQASQVLERKFGVKIAFRQMLENLSTIHDLADYLDRQLPPEAFAADPASVPVAAPAVSNATLESVQAQLMALTRELEELRRMKLPASSDSSAESAKSPIQKGPAGDGAEEAVTLPLTEPQKELWLASQASENASRAFNQVFAIHLSDRVQAEGLAEILQELVSRHDSLRTTFAADGSGQTISPSWKIELPSRDLSALSAPEQEAETTRALAREDQTAFDLLHGPLFRARLLKLSGGRCILILAAHHIILDGWSMAVLLGEFGRLYQAREGGPAADLEPAMQYREYARWQNSPEHRAAVQSSEAYWIERFSQLPSDFELPADRPRPPVKTYRAAEEKLLLDSSLYDSMKQSAAAHDCTLFVFLLAGLKAWMFRLTGEEDLVVGVPTAGQLTAADHPGNKSLVGHCVNALPLRSRCDGEARFADHLKNIKGLLLDAHEHQDITLGTLVRKLKVRTDPGRPPLIPLMFNIGRAGRQLRIPDGHASFPPKGFSFFDLNIEASDSGKDIHVVCRYNVDLFDAPRIERLLNHFRTFLAAAVAEPDQKLRELPLLTGEERRQIVTEWNRTEVDYPQDRGLHELIEEQAARAPEAVAVAFENQQLTYRELNARANQLARHLQKLGVGPDTLVGICVERSLEMVVGLLGILKAGGAYVPLDPEYPTERLAFMLEDANVAVLLTQAHLVGTMPSCAARLIRLDADWPAIAGESDAPVKSAVTAENLAYMIYTSGSTGRPKGAMNTHQGIVNRLLWMQDAYQLTPADRVLQKTPFSFDVSVWEFFWPLLTGARLMVARPGGHKDPGYLAQLIAREKITTIHFVPSMLQMFLEQENLSSSCSSLRRVICSGEALPMELQRRFFSMLGAELHNLYGPTEAAVDVTFWACERNSPLNTVPIGRPIANTQIYILDGQLQPVPVGVAGELHIGGVGLARGYHNRPELTAEKFIPDPFSVDPKARLYKTGDSARFLPDGNVEYLGRLDHQVKIRGFRVELGEIEEALNQYPGVQTSVVVAREDRPGDKRLVAYIVSRNGTVRSSELRECLGAKLPDYMVPAAFVTLEALPLTPNGKVDRKVLPKPDFEAGADKDKFVAPGTPGEVDLAKIWCEVLGLKQVGVHDNFFELGGHSMLAVQLIGKINKSLGCHLSIPLFFQNPTIKKLATVLEQADHDKSESKPAPASAAPMIAFHAQGSRRPLFFLHGDWSDEGFYCGRLSQQLGEDQPFYALHPHRAGKETAMTLEEMAAYHVASIREHSPQGPYLLGGYCIGATVTIEVARQLMKQGEKVTHLLLLDPTPQGPRLRGIWPWFDRGGDLLKWDLRKKIDCFDRYAVSFTRWLGMPLRSKVAALGRRLGLAPKLAASVDSSPMAAEFEAGPGGGGEELDSLDYSIYFLAFRLYDLKPLSVPITVYFPEEAPLSRFSWVKRTSQKFPKVTIEMVPGNHRTCITQHTSVLVDKMKKTLDSL